MDPSARRCAIGATLPLALATPLSAQTPPPSERGETRSPAAPAAYPAAAAGDGATTGGYLITVAPNLTVSPSRTLRLTAEVQRAWRADVRDAVYRANGQPFAGTQDVRAARIADIARLQAVWTATPRLSFTGRYEHLSAGPSLTGAGYRSSNLFAIWSSFRF